MPTRFCLKNIGPRESSLIAIAIISITGDKTTMPNIDRNKSIKRFIWLRYKVIPPLMIFVKLPVCNWRETMAKQLQDPSNYSQTLPCNGQTVVGSKYLLPAVIPVCTRAGIQNVPEPRGYHLLFKMPSR